MRATLTCLGLNNLSDRDPASLSGGQKQLLALASVLALQPQLLVLDEPTNDLDPWWVDNLLQILQGLRREQHLSLLLLGQDLRLTEHCDRIVFLEQGSITAAGPPAEILPQVKIFRRLRLSPHPLAALFHDLGQLLWPLTLNKAESVARQLGLGEREVRERVEAALKQVRLVELADEDPFSLTNGQRQRLAVAAVLALAPTVIILDEPTTGLDHTEQLGMMTLIRDLNRQGHTIIIVTHSMWAAAEYANRLIILRDGRLVLDGPTRQVLAQEEVLAACHLYPPLVVRLAHRLGFSALNADEFRARVAS
ncbi:MAG: ATP-binding cassette domain-containing protein [Deltaproteobacteria bacterium]|nr:ATP-binding cassette domain-containing protein [Deltaproteobacteria bacterium]MBW1952052.1 ATP-binding cassette domain-containing protein [Deltaproteobacteria bacterium]MBW1986945.1 ATP-binding cassette domain-containing protein [Deltaproteobacteria bacterium]MBW2134066.1 ATP-binding cassette domain-containing protein [Deltaproteobacteria bacterium]